MALQTYQTQSGRFTLKVGQSGEFSQILWKTLKCYTKSVLMKLHFLDTTEETDQYCTECDVFLLEEHKRYDLVGETVSLHLHCPQCGVVWMADPRVLTKKQREKIYAP